jgi:hypothetical protein
MIMQPWGGLPKFFGWVQGVAEGCFAVMLGMAVLVCGIGLAETGGDVLSALVIAVAGVVTVYLMMKLLQVRRILYKQGRGGRAEALHMQEC